jgi:hypothetical protein
MRALTPPLFVQAARPTHPSHASQASGVYFVALAFHLIPFAGRTSTSNILDTLNLAFLMTCAFFTQMTTNSW